MGPGAAAPPVGQCIESTVTALNSAQSWDWNYTAALTDAGYDVCRDDLLGKSTVDIQDSTEGVVYAIDQIHAATGRKVDVIGHGQGNEQLRWAVKWWPSLQSKVDDMVNLAGPDHGGTGAAAQCNPDCIRAAPS
ncbi:esterase/lipase family protein [Streptomyces sp. NPDC057580]|uniref:esterase/lipase family protein n=1 Tax=Streptomyces sp. NPDC057580 TaxID=3346173 RepID=UPI00368BB73A